MIKLKDLISELQVTKPGLEIFVKNNKVKIFEAAKKIYPNLAEETDLEDINSAICSSFKLGEIYPDLTPVNMHGEVHEVSIIKPGNEDSCVGLSISDLPNSFWEEMGSGFGYTELPNIKFNNSPVYAMTMWC